MWQTFQDDNYISKNMSLNITQINNTGQERFDI